MKAHKSALGHGIDEADSLHAARHYVDAADLEDDHPARQFRLGFDLQGRLPELVVLRFDSGNELLIHAMKARPQYFELLP
ncbi:toxin [Rhodococcus ruber]|uniref:toxin n=1 Tax=Rhodococcus ruber TaxID=1830 RepID=UPI00177E73B7|nr:toxin [Rhodococcus ruber]MBD8055654.1 toxin [Rhodococcus ruber]MCF8786900.1 toxin [Rhodococcus ruber]